MAQPLIVEPAAAEFDFYKLPRRRKLRAQAKLVDVRSDLRSQGLEFRQVRHHLKWLRWQAASDSTLAQSFEGVLAAASELDRCIKQAEAAVGTVLNLGAGDSNTREPKTSRVRQVRRGTTTRRAGSDSDPPGLPPLGLHWTQTGLKLSDLAGASQNGGAR